MVKLKGELLKDALRAALVLATAAAGLALAVLTQPWLAPVRASRVPAWLQASLVVATAVVLIAFVYTVMLALLAREVLHR